MVFKGILSIYFNEKIVRLNSSFNIYSNPVFSQQLKIIPVVFFTLCRQIFVQFNFLSFF